MSATRDPDRLFQAFLDEGPEVLPDRVLEAIADDVHGQRQRTVFGPWRFPTMRNLMAAAAVVAVVAIGGGILYASMRGSEPPAGTDADPTATSSATASADLAEPIGTLVPGETYHATSFSQPFSFTLPSEAEPMRADLWSDQNTLRLRDPGAITFHDDAPLTNDICHPTGVIPDIPDGADAIGTWLESSDGLTVSPESIVSIGDSSQAHYWDVELGSDCVGGGEAPGGPVVSFSAGEHHRVYAVPLGDDWIVVFTWGAGYGGEGDEVLQVLNPLADAIVGSMVAGSP